MRARLLSIFLLVISGHVHAADAPQTRQLAANAKSPPAKIADIAWLQGHWVGKALGGDTEEMWMPPQHGVMLGMYRRGP